MNIHTDRVQSYRLRRIEEMFHNIFRCYRVVQEMLIARGYTDRNNTDNYPFDQDRLFCTNQDLIPDAYDEFTTSMKRLCQENESPDGINQKVLDRLTYLRQHKLTDEWIYVFFVCEKIGVNLITAYVEAMTEGGVARAVLVSIPSQDRSLFGDQSVLTPFADKEIEKYKNTEGKLVEHFYMDDLLTNTLKHDFQPKEINVLTEEEKREIVELHSTRLDQFHRILMHDPVARFLGLQPNDMIQCVGRSETAGETNRYRMCFNE